MGKFRKRPVVVEAEQWFPGKVIAGVGENYAEATATVVHNGVTLEVPPGHGACPTLEGSHLVTPGDWIITGVKGERYRCKPDIFEATYEPVDE